MFEGSVRERAPLAKWRGKKEMHTQKESLVAPAFPSCLLFPPNKKNAGTQIKLNLPVNAKPTIFMGFTTLFPIASIAYFSTYVSLICFFCGWWAFMLLQWFYFVPSPAL